MRFDWCKANLHTACEEHKYDHCEMCNIARAYQHGYEIGQEDMSKTGWIPVSERLPIPPTFCLVTTDGSHGDVIDIALYMSDGWHKASEVLAWMPLPEPYKEMNHE